MSQPPVSFEDTRDAIGVLSFLEPCPKGTNIQLLVFDFTNKLTIIPSQQTADMGYSGLLRQDKLCIMARPRCALANQQKLDDKTAKGRRGHIQSEQENLQFTMHCVAHNRQRPQHCRHKTVQACWWQYDWHQGLPVNRLPKNHHKQPAHQLWKVEPGCKD